MRHKLEVVRQEARLSKSSLHIHDVKVGLSQVLPYDYNYNFVVYINIGSNVSDFNFAFWNALTLSQLCN